VTRPRFFPTLVAALLLSALNAFSAPWQSSVVTIDAKGNLSTPADADGNRVPDFSNAGYRGGGVALPEIRAVKIIEPVEGDNTAHIQAALDEVGALEPQENGFRGGLRLTPGVYEVTGTLRMNHSGVVLMGSGFGDPARNSIIRRTGASTEPVIIAGGGRDDNFRSEVRGTRCEITTPVVPAGAHSFDVAHPEFFHVGDAIIIEQRGTDAWLDAIHRGDTKGEAPWQIGDINIRYHRYVTAIAGATLTIDAPVFNRLDRALATSTVFAYDRGDIVTDVGIENLFVDVVTNGETSEDHAKICVQFAQAENCWARRVATRHFVQAGIQFGPSVTRSTALDCRAIEPHSTITGERRYNFATAKAQLILFENCYASYARHSFVCNGASLDSGIVVLDGVIDHPLASAEGHRRWSQGILFDGVITLHPETKIILGLYNRGDYGTGHGWAAVNSVAWRCDVAGAKLVVQRPPIGQNYAIGCSGDVTGAGPFEQPAGFIEGTGRDDLEPHSLYRAQLAQRLRAVSPPPHP
jgi:hypothetical protein